MRARLPCEGRCVTVHHPQQHPNQKQKTVNEPSDGKGKLAPIPGMKKERKGKERRTSRISRENQGSVFRRQRGEKETRGVDRILRGRGPLVLSEKKKKGGGGR